MIRRRRGLLHDLRSFRELVCQDDRPALKAALVDPQKLVRYQYQLQPDTHGQTLLMYAVRKNREECALILAHELDAPFFNLRERANRASTALHLAAQKGYYNLVTYLVKNGADPGIYDAEGHTPLSLAVGPDRKRVRDYLWAVTSGAWTRQKWSPRIHMGCPPKFHNEAFGIACVNHHYRCMSKDVMAVVLDWLLELHRRERRGEMGIYFPQSQRELQQCAAMTKKGIQCKMKEKLNNGGKCWRHGA